MSARFAWVSLGIVALVYLAPARVEAQSAHHVTVFKEAERFAGWPANNGIWAWGNEIVVDFSLGYYKEDPAGSHAIDRQRPSTVRQARSLDGGETWAIETPTFLDEKGSERPATDSPGGIDFSCPDLALRFRGDVFMYSLDRCKTWQGPHKLPKFGRSELLARTDYLVDDKNTVTAFVAAAKDNGKEGQPLVYTDDGRRQDLEPRGVDWQTAARELRLRHHAIYGAPGQWLLLEHDTPRRHV